MSERDRRRFLKTLTKAAVVMAFPSPSRASDKLEKLSLKKFMTPLNSPVEGEFSEIKLDGRVLIAKGFDCC